MKKITPFYLFLFFMAMSLNTYSQVDIVYSDLVWSDEFNTNGAVNPSNWHHQTQLPAGGSWFNGEVQHYTKQIANSSVNAGFLNIKAIKDPFTDQGVTKQYTSARLNSKFAFLYGRVDVRAKIPVTQGTWPAIWLLGKNVNEDGGFFDAQFGTTDWPACGEIDMMEHGITSNQPTNYVQSALHTPSSFGNTMNIGGIIATDLVNNFHVYSMNWSPFQITFLLDGVAYYTYNPAVKNASNWPFNAEQYILLNIAMGGIAGTIPANFTEASMEVDYVRVYQNTVVDTESPTNFTASLAAVTGSTVELLLNGNDNSGTILYTINYGSTTITVAGTSGVQKSVVIPNLLSSTAYVFTITAADLAGNNFVNNPLVVNATTTISLDCSGTDSEAQQGSFTTGYNYKFETIGTDVKITFEMLDTAPTGVIAYLWKQSPFYESQMTNVSGKKFTKTITGQTIGTTINYAVKFAFAGGLAVTKYFSYVVGNDCSLSISNPLKPNVITFKNPAKYFIEIQSELQIDKVEIHSITGSIMKSTTKNLSKIDISNLSSGIYIVSIYSENEKSVKKLVVE